ncbi:MAG TPA: ADOP family duplicated permease [Thermoanaerobaculia bacterium]|nr:ADOP family duplicated permease [Thermoanaerobaculia bacterium]
MHRIASELRYRLRALLRNGEMEAELDDELRFHLDRHAEKLMAAGLPRREAERQARIAFGGVARIKEDARAAWGLALFETTLQDLRCTVRALRKRRDLTFGIVATLALGIGANATMFGIVDRLLVRAPATMLDPERVHRVYLHTSPDGEAATDRNLAFPRYLDVARGTSSFDVVAAFQTRQVGVGEGATLREVPVTVASAAFFDLFAARPALGRFFTAAEDVVPEGSPVVVLGHAFWQSHFGGRRDVLGQPLRVDRLTATIVGVAPEGFVGMADQGVPAAYVPITAFAHSLRGPDYAGGYGWSWLELVARRKPGVPLATAEADLTQALGRSWRAAAEQDPGWGSAEDARPRGELAPVHVQRGPDATADSRVATWIAGVALVALLVACANVANLLLARAHGRRREIAMRIALGVSRGRLLRHLAMESLVLALLGGGAGLLLAEWGGGALRRLFLPEEAAAVVLADGRTLLFAGGLTLLVALLTGLLPILHSRRTDLADAFRAGMGEGQDRRSRASAGLLVLQTTLSVLLLVGAGLFVRSLHNLLSLRLGYDVDPVLFAAANPRGVELSDAETAGLNRRLLAAAQAMPGVRSAALAASVPFWSNEGRGLWVEGIDEVGKRGSFVLQAATPGYFETLGTRILRGRAFDERDGERSPRVVVVSDGMARALWPGRDPLGRCLRIGEPDAPCTTVIGIAEHVRSRDLFDAREHSYTIPASQYGSPMYPQLFVRAEGDAAALVEPLRRRLQREMPGAAYVRVLTLRSLVDPNLRAWRFGAVMFTAFGGLTLALAAIGLYSLLEVSAARRRRELGVRVALGASTRDVVRLIVTHGLRLVLLGVALGGALALWAAPSLESLMVHESVRDPLVYGVVAALLLAAALLASIAPAWRALRLDPTLALRAD